ncbi:IclR family transcriptional regulator [Rhodococcus sp. WS4]|nr:IclR family transcriptional regulator [Rhodococcus sp. WS4]
MSVAELSVNESTRSMGSVDNALRILMLVGETKSVRVVDVADHLGVSRSTSHRLLDALNRRGFVMRDAAHIYRIGPAFTHTGLVSERMPRWQPKVRLHMRELVSQTGKTCHLAVLEGNSVRVIDGMSSEQFPRVGSRVGMLLPAHSTAVGKAILGEMSAEAVRALYPFGLPGATPSSPTEPVKMLALRRELATAHHRGYAINVGETEVGVTAVGAPLHDESGRTIAAIALAATTTRIPSGDLHDLTTRLKKAVNVIEKEIAIRHDGSV